MYHYCTLFDRNYLFKGLALYQSLRRHAGPFELWVVCLDAETREVLSRLELPHVRLISLEAIEEAEPALLEAKSNRNQVEYFITCKPFVLLYVLRQHPHVEVITHLDADLFFFSTPEPIYSVFQNHSILIVEHGYSPRRVSKFREKFGVYQAGLVTFRNDEEAFRCLRHWSALCLEACPAEPAEGRFGDQKYLDDWPRRFRNVAVLRNKGANVGPWDIHNYRIARAKDTLLVDSDPLMFFHFSQFRIYSPYLFAQVFVYITRKQRKLIYGAYIAELQRAIRTVRSVRPDFNYGFFRYRAALPRRRQGLKRFMVSFPR